MTDSELRRKAEEEFIEDDGMCPDCEKKITVDHHVCVGCQKIDCKEFMHNYPEGYYCESCWDAFKG